MKYKRKPDCNRCQPVIDCKGKIDSKDCAWFLPPKDTWMLAELALAHPTSLNEALSVLPFDVNLNFYLN